MTADKAITIFRELTIGHSKLNVSVRYWGSADPEMQSQSYEIEIATPLPPGYKDRMEEIKKRYKLSEIRIPVRYSTGKGRLILS